MTTSMPPADAIYSSFADDPMLGELVEMYVAEMPDRIAALEQAYDGGDMVALCRAAHQMKGTGGSYGFDGVTDAAAALEALIREERPAEAVRQALATLGDVCRRVQVAPPH